MNRAAQLLAALAAAFGLRAMLMVASGASLHVDEAQYWAWSRELAWGYFSKPPGVAVLIRASTALFGDTEFGVRALAMLAWLLAGLALVPLARALAPDAPHAGLWAAAVFLCSPLAGLLGMVATTDALLVLCWALALCALWHAVQRRSARAWLGFSVACGLGLLDKYTMLALLPGALGWAWWAGRRDGQPHAGRALAACTLAVAFLLPNLMWNDAAGWPTLLHTAEITVRSGRDGLDIAGLLLFIVGQGLIAAPLLVPMATWRLLRGHVAGPLPAWGVFLLFTSAPLVAAGLVQAAIGHAELNWIAPAHLGVALALACARQAWLGSAHRALGMLVAQVALVAWMIVLPALLNATAPASPWAARLDLWARMRGWEDAFAALAVELPARQPVVVVTTSRTVQAQAAWHWRDRGLSYAAWPVSTTPTHHFELRCPWRPGLQPPGAAVYVLSQGLPPPALTAGAAPRQVASAEVAVWGQPRQLLVLTELREPPARGADVSARRTCR